MNLLKKTQLDFIKNNFFTQKTILIVLLLIYIILVVLFKPSCQFFIKHVNNKLIIFPLLISIIWLSQDNFLLGVCLVVALLITINLQKIEKFTDNSESSEEKNDSDTTQEEEEEDIDDSSKNDDSSKKKESSSDKKDEEIKGHVTQIKLLKKELDQKNSKIQDLNQQLENEKNKPFSEHATRFFYDNAEKFMQSDLYKDKDHLFSKFIEMFEENVKQNKTESIEPFVGFNYIH